MSHPVDPGHIGPGSEIDGFVVEAVAGRGGMGVVYRARQREPERTVALKVIAGALGGDLMFQARFRREASIAAQIEHPNVIPVYAVGQAGDVLYIAMRFVEGTDMRAILAGTRIEPVRAAAIIDQVAQALDAAHAHGLVHRDVKPANILIATAGSREHVYLSDFGLSRRIDNTQELTSTGALLGTIDYVAPEQARGERVDARTDIYALGCVLFQALTGSVPFPLDNDMAKLYAHDTKPPPSPLELVPDLPHAFEAVLARAMAKVPEDRYLSAGDLGRAAVAAASNATLSRSERTVGVGPAAPQSADAVPTKPLAGRDAPTARRDIPTVTDPAPTVRDPAPTVRDPAPAAATVSGPPGRRGMPVVPILAVLATAAAVAIAVVVATGGGDSKPESQVALRVDATATATPTPEETETPTETETPAPTETATETQTAVPTSEVVATPRPARYFTYTGPAFQARLPQGSGWGRPAQSQPTPGRLFRTSVRASNGRFVIIDYTPFEPAQFGGTYFSRTNVGQTAFGTATRYVFQGGTLPECQRTPCVDYIINDRANGSGFGVLAGGANFNAAASLARTVAESVVPG